MFRVYGFVFWVLSLLVPKMYKKKQERKLSRKVSDLVNHPEHTLFDMNLVYHAGHI